MAANKDLTPYGLQLYLYLASNMDGYEFGLSPEHAKEAAHGQNLHQKFLIRQEWM